MTLASRAAAVAFASLFLMGTAFAQAPAAAPAAPAAKAAPAATPAAPAAKATEAKAKPERTAASLECSKEADAKGLKGKERKKFRSQCKRDAGKAAK
ncbi:PsiF family protein [Bradyrhizobium prioriisuperbiae]|uniref:PsiF family protein n=1 Tax=Bradyrhizobium prioriisuperbiae TaxID=2854389 RepID=UPI0028EB0A55|nr:PsiF family protein [Bradyrhizobium prioritasuperba]